MAIPPGVVLIDGVRCKPGEEKISVYDRGFLYGDSVFEVVRTYGGRPFGLEEHVARLHRSAEKIEMPLPWTEAETTAEVLRAVEEGGFPESWIRVVVTRGVADSLGLDPDLATRPTRVVMVHALTLPPPAVYRDGVSVLVVESLRATDHTRAEGAKSSNYLANLLAVRDAKRAGAYEPLFVEPRAGADPEVLEGGTSNVFVIEGRTLLTPPERRILGGITRRHVLAAAPSAGFEVREEPLSLDRLCAADEAFLTSTVREVVPIVRVVDAAGARRRDVGAGRPGEGTRALHVAFRRQVGASTAPMPWDG